MFGMLGASLFGTDHMTGPKSQEETKSARFARHDLVRGKPAFQDLGNDAETLRLSFFFDETFCNVETELAIITAAFELRTPMRLMLDISAAAIGVYQIQSLTIRRQQTTSSGRVTRADLDVELIENIIGFDGLLGAAAGIVRAIANPFLKVG